MEFVQTSQPRIDKPIMIAAMQDMGNVGSIVINFINNNMRTRQFRIIRSEHPSYVIDRGGYIDVPDESWEYRYSNGLIVFGGGHGQPQESSNLDLVCKDVIDTAKKHSVKFIYTAGGFHTNRKLYGSPKTYVTATSAQMAQQMHNLDVESTKRSIITGFNGMILGYAKQSGIHGIGMYGELNDPEIPQYRAAISVIRTLEKMTFRKIGSTERLESMAREIEDNFGDTA